MDINNSGMVVGGSEYTGNNVNNHAFLYDGTKMIDLGTHSDNLPDVSDYTGNYSVVINIMSS